MTRSLLALALAVLAPGCAAYIPAAFSSAMLEHRGDVHLGASFGTHGYQGDVAYALTDSMMLGLTGQYASGAWVDNTATSGNGREPYFLRGADLRLGWIATGKPEVEGEYQKGRRFTLGGSFGAGYARRTWSLLNTTEVHSGAFLRPGLFGELGYEWEYAAVGTSFRALAFSHIQDNRSTNSGANYLYLMAEGCGFVRAGSEHVKAELQIGVSLPLASLAYFPLIVSLGLVADF